MNYLSSNLKYLRIENRLTQDDIAKIVEKTRSLISAWETDERSMTTEDIIKLSNYFNIPMDVLVGQDLRNYEKSNSKSSQREMLFNKTKDILTDDDWAQIEFTMQRAINRYEEQKNNNQNSS